MKLSAGRLVNSLVVLVAMGAGMAGCDSPNYSPLSTPLVPPVKPQGTEPPMVMLKQMSDVLSGAKTLSFTTINTTAVSAPNGQFVHLIGTSRVVMERPNHLFVETRGDQFPQDFYFDGKTVTMYAPKENLYAQHEATGDIDAMLKKTHETAGNFFPFHDVLLKNVYGDITQNVGMAMQVGQSEVRGVKVDHLAFAGEGIEWEVWIGVQDRLPRLLRVTYTNVPKNPTFMVEFNNWVLNGAVDPKTFVFTVPLGGATKIDFVKLEKKEAAAKAKK